MRVFWLVALLLSGFGVAQSAERVEVMSQDQTYPAYLTVPEGDGQKPAVVLLHSIRGQQPGYETVANQLAADGFVVLALEWQTYETEPPLDVMDALLRDSLAYLGGRGDVDPERVGLTGFCIGGYYTMYYLPTISEFAAGVAWYGFPKRGEEGRRPIDEAIVSQLEAPLLIFHGTADGNRGRRTASWAAAGSKTRPPRTTRMTRWWRFSAALWGSSCLVPNTQ